MDPEVIEEDKTDGVQETEAKTPEADATDATTEAVAEETPAEEPQEPAETPLLRDIRKMLREEKKRARDLERELQTLKAPAPTVLGAKPRLEDFDYYADQFETAIASWYDKKREVDRKEEEKRTAEQQAAQAWQTKVQAYEKAKAEFPADQIEDAEDVVQTLFSATQQGILLQGAGANAAKMVVELGKNPMKAKALSEIKDPVEFAIEVGVMKAGMSKSQDRKSPPPEKTISGGSSKVTNAKDRLEQLRDEAQKTGNFDAFFAFKRQMK